jgi:hypothetical protein
VILGMSVLASTPLTRKKLTDEERIARREARKKEFNRYYGGFINDVRQQQGKISIVNAQKSIPIEWLNQPIQFLSNSIKVKLEIVLGTFSFPSPKPYGNFTIFLVSEKTIPTILVAPEQNWCVVNVLPLVSDKESFYKARIRKEFMRGFAMLCGASMSSYENPLMAKVSQVSDLDNIADFALPKDIVKKCEKYLVTNGVTQYKRRTFRDACEEGWAPTPTNDVQKAIWDEVRAAPKNPMKIEFDPKKGR